MDRGEAMKTRRRKKPPSLEALIPKRLRSTFRSVEIAEEEIARGYPDPRDCPPELFMACIPPRILRPLRSELYRAHARELVERSKLRKPVYKLPTKAEVLAGLLEASKRAPLNRAGMALADRLFTEIFGWSFESEPAREEWPGQLEEELEQARHRMAAGR